MGPFPPPATSLRSGALRHHKVAPPLVPAARRVAPTATPVKTSSPLGQSLHQFARSAACLTMQMTVLTAWSLLDVAVAFTDVVFCGTNLAVRNVKLAQLLSLWTAPLLRCMQWIKLLTPWVWCWKVTRVTAVAYRFSPAPSKLPAGLAIRVSHLFSRLQEFLLCLMMRSGSMRPLSRRMLRVLPLSRVAVKTFRSHVIVWRINSEPLHEWSGECE